MAVVSDHEPLSGTHETNGSLLHAYRVCCFFLSLTLKTMSLRPVRFLLFLLLVTSACQPPSADPAPEPADAPSVFRSVLDERARMITLALKDDLWVAYSAETGALYRVWRDGVNFDGAVYTTVHGPQPTSLGPAYVLNDDLTPWRLVQEGQTTQPAVQYKGHLVRDSLVTMRLQLGTPHGTVITVTETPRYVEDAAGHAGLQRTFTTADVPEGTVVGLMLYLGAQADAGTYTTDGTFTFEENRNGRIRVRLALAANGQTTFTSYFREPTVAATTQSVDGTKPPGLALIERSDCVACHNADVQTVGPSYRAMAEKYDATDATITRLATKVIEGGAGVWGESMMAPHPTLSPEDAKTMVAYILSLRGGGQPTGGTPLDVDSLTYPLTEQRDGSNGLAVNLFPILGSALTLDELKTTDVPYYSGTVPALHTTSEIQMGEVTTNFYLEATGYLNVPETDNYVIRLVCDDGGRVYLDGSLLIDHDGLHGADPRDSEVILEAGRHPIRVTFFQAGGGAALSLQWARSSGGGFSVIPPEAFTFDAVDLREALDYDIITGKADRRPGDQLPLVDVHPSFAVETIRPDAFQPKVGGLDVMDDGRVVVSTWEADGPVYLLSNIEQGDPEQIVVKRIATGLAEPLGLKGVDGTIYVLQKQELTRLIDTDGDDVIDVYETVANDWGATGNFHEFAFGLVYKDGSFYATLATAILPGGASASPQNPDRGSVIKINNDTGDVAFIARGLRTPNGISLGVDGEIFVADNQGDWLPASKILHIREGAFYGSRSVDFEGTAGLTAKLPVVWLPQDEIGNSPSQPAPLNVGPYQNQMIHGEVTHGGIKRVFVEKVDGEYQGAVFRFTQGLEAGVNRIVWGPDGKLYIGGVGNPGNWGHVGKLMHGLQRMAYTGAPVFEMLAVRALPDGFEIEFTEPLAEGVGEAAGDYGVAQWYYEPTADYGGPKLDQRSLPVEAVQVSADRKRVRLKLGGLQPNHLVYFRLNDQTMRSEAGRSLWTTEAWYTLNRIPSAPAGGP